ncbi:hypothetical protein AB0N50_34190 [Streptomyces pharetrae]|jgi:hypothetical protein|uniref:hypothetical protein n=1 Tax=Streptomyces pharetrae TaxID=291370 RepID=UPI00345F4D0F
MAQVAGRQLVGGFQHPLHSMPTVAGAGSSGRTSIDEARMPRSWLRWVSGIALGEHKVTENTGRDNQLACYLPDCEVFLSEDRHFARTLQQVKESAPVPLPEIHWVGIKASGGRAVGVFETALA